MLCELCNKKEASITIKQISENGSSVSYEICERCAKKYKLDVTGNSNDGIENIFKAIEEKTRRLFSKINCPSCGTKLSNIIKYSRIGCSDCVFYFKSVISKTIKREPKYEIYTGPKPKVFKIINNPSQSVTVNNLKRQLKQAVQIENYELAAYLRDRIKELENENK